MKFYDVARPLYLETDASGICHGLLQVRDGVNCRHDEILGSAILCPIVFASRRCKKKEEVEHSMLQHWPVSSD